MSNSASIANFYIDSDGKERPIRFRAADLVNRPAPEGYYWFKGHPWRPHYSEKEHEIFAAKDNWIQDMKKKGEYVGYVMEPTLDYKKDEEGFYDYYVCAKEVVKS